MPLRDPFSWAVMVVVPLLTSVASPFFGVGLLAIVATAVFEDDQVRFDDLVRSCVPVV